MCTSVQSYKVSAALLHRGAHLGNLLSTLISIGSKIKFIDTMGIGWGGQQEEHWVGEAPAVASGDKTLSMSLPCARLAADIIARSSIKIIF